MSESQNTISTKYNLYERYIMTVGILGQSMHYIQAYKIFSPQSAELIQ